MWCVLPAGERQARQLIINIFCLSLTSSSTAENTITTTQHCPASGMKGNTKALRKAVFACDSQGFLVEIHHFQHNIMRKSTTVAALQAQTQLKCSNFIKLEDIAHVRWLIIFRVKLAEINHVYRSLRVQLWGAFSCCWAEVQPTHTTQGIHVHDSELHSDPHCVFLCVCSQRVMNNLSRNNAGATGLARWNGEEESSLRTASELKQHCYILAMNITTVSLGVV